MGDQKDKVAVLFVDDEPRVVDSMRRMLFSMRDAWDMEFVTSGQDALVRMKEKHFDVVVSDMRMPGMDGAQLLATVQHLYPSTIRFILSGYSDKEMIIRTIGATDQFLSKPCDSKVLIETIQHALQARVQVDKQVLKNMVARMEKLPTLPNLYNDLVAVLESDRSSFADIARVVMQDVTVSAKVLQLVNSAFFGLRTRIDDIKRAVTYLGIETLKSIVIVSDVFSKFKESEIQTFGIDTLYEHSYRVGLIASKIVMMSSHDQALADAAVMPGMLHDIGKLLFIQNMPKEYEEMCKQCKSDDSVASVYEAEKKAFKITHADLGGYLMGIWGLPEDIVSSITKHHNPAGSLGRDMKVAGAVFIANMLDHEHMRGTLDQDDHTLECTGHLDKYGLLKYLPEWKKIVQIIAG